MTSLVKVSSQQYILTLLSLQTNCSDDRLRHDSKTSNVICVDSDEDNDLQQIENNESANFYSSSSKSKAMLNHTRKRSTADDDSYMEKEDEEIHNSSDSAEILLLKENGESQAKRSKSAQNNKDWWPWSNWGSGSCHLLWFFTTFFRFQNGGIETGSMHVRYIPVISANIACTSRGGVINGNG